MVKDSTCYLISEMVFMAWAITIQNSWIAIFGVFSLIMLLFSNWSEANQVNLRRRN